MPGMRHAHAHSELSKLFKFDFVPADSRVRMQTRKPHAPPREGLATRTAEPGPHQEGAWGSRVCMRAPAAAAVPLEDPAIGRHEIEI